MTLEAEEIKKGTKHLYFWLFTLLGWRKNNLKRNGNRGRVGPLRRLKLHKQGLTGQGQRRTGKVEERRIKVSEHKIRNLQYFNNRE